MRRGTKTIKPETSPIAGGTQRTPADQARAKQWCRLFIRIDVGDMKADMSVGNGMGRIASVSRTSGKARRVAQILTPGAAIVTAPAAMHQPRNAPPVTRPAPGHPLPQPGAAPDTPLARDHRKLHDQERNR